MSPNQTLGYVLFIQSLTYSLVIFPLTYCLPIGAYIVKTFVTEKCVTCNQQALSAQGIMNGHVNNDAAKITYNGEWGESS